MMRKLVGVLLLSASLAAGSYGALNAATLTARAKAQAAARHAKSHADSSSSAKPSQTPKARTAAATPAPAPVASAAASPRRAVRSAPIRAASAAGPWTPSSALPSSRDVDNLLPENDTYTTHGTGTVAPPPLGRTWDPNRETYSQWYSRVIAGTAADPSTYPTSGGPNSGNSSTSTSGTNQYGEWAYSDDVHLVGRVYLPDGQTPGAGFTVYIVPMFLNPPFPFPIIRTYSDSSGYFYADLWAQGVWSIAVTKDTPLSESRTVYTAWTPDRLDEGDNTVILQSRLGGSRR